MLKDLKEFTDDPANNPKGRKFKNLSERRKYVKELGLTVVRDPKTNADAVPVHDRTVMLSGHRVSASRSKQENFDDKREANIFHGQFMSKWNRLGSFQTYQLG